ncbi:mannitol dehydrogenase family protein [Exilibacterium tricleocarpae]|uniref:Mannitol dehydrogenase family protein n=1 Tax=Exilibacterium tricleocarpae TaxID=2591008 RepID=A0A545U6L1_9GAMM|nr:mannitol dehydrogenase family protein [Exilibacterium tricleocarpae]TQV85111.1 mannitol dehydrogenase family protein [Exilibacterium tricleocarpae]
MTNETVDDETTESGSRLHAGYTPREGAPVTAPGYDRQACGTGIVHLGIGAFQRAHQAVYTDEVLARQGGDWKILGVSLRSAGVRDQLNPQDGLYTLVEMGAPAARYRIVGAVGGVLVAPEDPAAVLQALTAASCKIISLTITEKGYCHDPASGHLNRQHPDILHDLHTPAAPKTAIGFIVEALHRRRRQDAPIPTILCCDNLPSNGTTLKRIAVEFARARDAQLAAWIDSRVPFPNTMVDRIVPATQAEDIADLQRVCGYRDLGMVKAEGFSQWVIEDNFSAGRPAWEAVGATLVSDVEPFELAKLRLLNGTHSSLAYLGFLAGYEFVHQVMEDGDFVAFLRGLMNTEVIPGLVAPEGVDLATYADSLLQRFANPSLRHRTYQIAMDGSQKLPQRLLGTLRDQLAAGGDIEHLALAVAGWLRYVMGVDEHGAVIAVQDPMAALLREIGAPGVEQQGIKQQARARPDAGGLVDAYLEVSAVFGTDLRGDDRFKNRLTHWLGELLAQGVTGTLKTFRTRPGAGGDHSRENSENS